jgi:transposase
MAMGTRKQREKQEDIWIAHRELPSAPGHPFYERLNELLEAEKFDEFVEGRCAKFYAAKYGRPSLTPGIYFRSLLLGYFEGIDSERGIAWRMADSLGLRRFVGLGLDALWEGISSRGEKRGPACQPFAFGRTQDSGNGENLCRPSPRD